MYPRFSETFIVSEILALEELGQQIEIFSLRPPLDSRFHGTLAEVNAPVRYLDSHTGKIAEFWAVMHQGLHRLPHLTSVLFDSKFEDARDIYQAIQLALQAQESQISHLHAHFATVATTVARLASLMLGITYSFTAHAKDIYHETVDRNRLETYIRDSSHTITISDYNHKHLTHSFPNLSKKILRIYNGLDLMRYPYQPPHPEHKSIVSVGRLVEKKGFKYLIHACHDLRNSGVAIPLRLIGGGPLEQELRDLISQLDLDDLVTMVGPCTHLEIIREVSAAGVFVAPCIVGSDGNRDGLPTVLLEAMALGTPCISTDVTAIPELIVHGFSGLLVAQADSIALSNSIRQLLGDSLLASELSANARQVIEDRFDIRSNIQAILANLDTALYLSQPKT